MKIILLPFLICLYLAASGQAPVITSADMPVVGDTFRYSVADNIIDIDPAPADTNYTWDFSSLVAASQYVDSFKSVISTDIAFAFVFNAADYAVPLSFSQNIGSMTVSNVFNFYNNSNAQYELLGFGAIVNGLPLPVSFTSPDIIFKFPLSYGNVDSSASSFTVSIPTVGTVHRTQTRTNYIDGWGTLILPSGSYQVLRIRSEVESLDSITGLPAAIPTTTIEYKWISKTSKLPLLEIVSTNGLTRAAYRDNYINFTSIEEPVDPLPISIFPNPASHNFTISNIPIENPLDIEIYDINGKLSFKSTQIPDLNGQIQIASDSFKNSPYIILIKSKGEIVAVRKLLFSK